MGEEISDGYHTFGELYEHRHALFIALMASHPESSWWSITHSDGTPCYEGYFIAGMNIGDRQVSYHLPVRLLDLVKSLYPLGQQPVYDGHTSQDVVDTLYLWVYGGRKGE